MTVKLNSLARWSRLSPSDAIVFEASEVGERRVRIKLNLEAVTAFFIGDEHGENFLCTVGPGLETVEFYATGAVKVYAEAGSGVVHYQDPDLEPTFVEIADPVIFTRIANRRTRNPELEEMMFRMNQNVERRMAQQADEIAAFYERRMQESENARTAETHDAGTPSPAGGSEVRAQSPGGERSGERLSPAAGGEPEGNEGD